MINETFTRSFVESRVQGRQGILQYRQRVDDGSLGAELTCIQPFE